MPPSPPLAAAAGPLMGPPGALGAPPPRRRRGQQPAAPPEHQQRSRLSIQDRTDHYVQLNAQLTMAKTAAYANIHRPKNTQKSYDPKQNEWVVGSRARRVPGHAS
jgi:hypothetical protein